MQGTAKGKVDIHVLRARGKRTTRWLWRCSCEEEGPLVNTKQQAVQGALGHGAGLHQRNARVIAPAT